VQVVEERQRLLPQLQALGGQGAELQLQLREIGAAVGVSVLCPGALATRIASSARNRPASAGPPSEDRAADQESMDRMNALVDAGRDPAEVAGLVVDAVAAGRFYVLTATNRHDAVRARAEAIISGDAPLPPLG
jgi:hypothetical protein